MRDIDIRRKSQKRYDKSPKGRASQARYRKSLKRKAALYRYNHSLKRKLVSSKYCKTEKGKATLKRNRYSEKGKLTAARGLAKHSKTEKRRLSYKRYAQTIKGKYKQKRNSNARRARKARVFSFRYAGDFAAVCDRYNHACVYCKSTLFPLTEDHYVPLSWGGHDAPWNLVPACKYCNSKKGARFWAIPRKEKIKS